ncbi:MULTISPECIES: 3-hydroxyacyl-ACP dehydratase FabZ family protein [Streptomyces]|uniref:3-hydroxyacyl-ACP dehydratase FabZ family protein n=1 Tax=Streptomyces TaxID=1883 RepID=UPI0004BD6B1E|nr:MULTISPECIES: dehydratase [Streptomyces]KOG79350.1 dehydratase [Streptomyces griseus subsp. rhodochrous]
MAPLQATPVQGTAEIVDRAPDRAATRVTVEAGEQVFPGHYPGFPIFPGVCVVEHIHLSALATAPEPGLRMEAIESTRFLSPVFPGDRLAIDLVWERKGEKWRCKAVAATPRGDSAKVRLRFSEGQDQ